MADGRGTGSYHIAVNGLIVFLQAEDVFPFIVGFPLRLELAFHVYCLRRLHAREPDEPLGGNLGKAAGVGAVTIPIGGVEVQLAVIHAGPHGGGLLGSHDGEPVPDLDGSPVLVMVSGLSTEHIFK